MKRSIPLPDKRLLAVVLAAVAVGLQPPPAGTGREDSPDDYRVLVECNIFLRDRGRPRRPRVVATKPIVRDTYDSDRSVMLRGVARNGDEFVALFEDLRTGATPTVRVGEAIGKGTVKAITLEGVEYQRAGSVRSIAIDQSLAGSVTATAPAGDPSIDPAAPPSQQPTTRPGGAAPSAPPGNAKDTAIKDILERLRQRREQELRK